MGWRGWLRLYWWKWSMAWPRCLPILFHLIQGLGSSGFGSKVLAAGLSPLPDIGRRNFLGVFAP